MWHAMGHLVPFCFILPLFALGIVCQQITPAPTPLKNLQVEPELHRRQQFDSYTITSIDFLSAAALCDSLVPGCKSYLDIWDICSAENISMGREFFCLCTRGYYDMSSSCSACSVSLGLITSFHYSGISLDDPDGCKYYSSQYASGFSFTSQVSNNDGNRVGDHDTSSGFLASIHESRRFTATETTRDSSEAAPTESPNIDEEPFGGLMATGQEDPLVSETGTALKSSSSIVKRNNFASRTAFVITAMFFLR